MIQTTARPRSSRVIRASEMSVYRRTSTFRRARARQTRTTIILVLLSSLIIPLSLMVAYVAVKSANPNASQCELLWGSQCHE